MPRIEYCIGYGSWEKTAAWSLRIIGDTCQVHIIQPHEKNNASSYGQATLPEGPQPTVLDNIDWNDDTVQSVWCSRDARVHVVDKLVFAQTVECLCVLPQPLVDVLY